MSGALLLVELVTEELPPKALVRLGKAFASGIRDGLAALHLLSSDSVMTAYATPRRLAVTISHVAAQAKEISVREKILPVAVALDAHGAPTATLLKRLSALGLDGTPVDAFERAVDGKMEALFFTRKRAGATLASALQEVLSDTVARLPIPKVMSYQLHAGTAAERTVQFVRPAHALVALHGEDIVAVEVLGLTANRLSLGHRFLSPGTLPIKNAHAYEKTLHDAGHVIASLDKRREVIGGALLAKANGGQVVMPDALLDEVNALVEWPVVYEAHFDAAFLEVPHECLLLTMQQNQKYFALNDSDGRMLPRFLLVSNLATKTPREIIRGNERVLRARLSDAKFFYDQDRKRTLESRVADLAQVVYHNKLGSQHQRTERLVAVSTSIAQLLGVETSAVKRAAFLSKADLLTEMVGEFPELQGLMGRYYAAFDGEPAPVAQAIEEHYRPRFSGDALPESTAGLCVSLADKLETLTGMFGVGNVPTGERDPFGLRRHALGMLRMLIEAQLPLELDALLALSSASFEGVSGFDAAAVNPLREFLSERLRGLLRDSGYSAQEVDAVLSLSPTRIDRIPSQLAAVRAFLLLPEAPSLAAANKRIANILKKSDGSDHRLDATLLVDAAERDLYQALMQLRPLADAAYRAGHYETMLVSLASLRTPVDAFFADVMVMSDDQALRGNRIALLRELHTMMNRAADLSRLAA